MMTANTVINQENTSLQSMGIDQLLDLFSLEDNKKGSSLTANSSDAEKPASTMKSILETLPELWDENQYEEEYNLDTFIQGLKK